MDPKALSHLDPKQREAYDRVMGHADGSNPITVSSDPPPSTDPNTPTAIEPNIISANPSAQGITDPLAASPLSDSPAVSDPMQSTPGLDATPNANTPTEPQANFGEPGPIDVSNLDGPTDTGGSSLSTQDGMASFDSSGSQGSDQLSAAPNTESSPSIFSAGPPPVDNTAPPADTSNSSFLSNPSPAGDVASKPSAFDSSAQLGPDQPANTDPLNSSTPITPYTPTPIGDNQPFNQPLPSPAEVNHAGGKETSALLKVLYIVGAVVFFAIYTIFWIKVFNLPFLF